MRRWSPRENAEIYGKFKWGWIKLRDLPFHFWSKIHFKQVMKAWGRVTDIDRHTLKLVDLSKAILRVEKNLNVMLPSLLEIKDGEWIFTVSISVIEEERGMQGRLKSTCCKGKLVAMGGGMQKGPL